MKLTAIHMHHVALPHVIVYAALIAGYASAGRNVRTLPGPNCTSFFSTEWPNVFLDTKESITGNPPCYGGGTLPTKREERYRCYRSNIWEETSGSGQLPDAYKYVTGLTYPSRTSINGPPSGADLDPNKLHMINFYDCSQWLNAPYFGHPDRWSEDTQCGSQTRYSVALLDPRTGVPVPPKCLEHLLAFHNDSCHSCNNTNETRQDPLVADPYEGDYSGNNSDASFPNLIFRGTCQKSAMLSNIVVPSTKQCTQMHLFLRGRRSVCAHFILRWRETGVLN